MNTMRVSPTVLLWAGNFLVLGAVLAYLAMLVWQMRFGSEDLPAVRPLGLMGLPKHLELVRPLERNPFDPSGQHWIVAGTTTGAVIDPHGFKGVMVLPGVRVALTSQGLIRPGESFRDGHLAEVSRRGIVVGKDARQESIKAPGTEYRRLEEINRKPPVASTQGQM